MKDDAIGEALATDANPFQYTITAQLLENQVGSYLARLRTKAVHFYSILLLFLVPPLPQYLREIVRLCT